MPEKTAGLETGLAGKGIGHAGFKTFLFWKREGLCPVPEAKRP